MAAPSTSCGMPTRDLRYRAGMSTSLKFSNRGLMCLTVRSEVCCLKLTMSTVVALTRGGLVGGTRSFGRRGEGLSLGGGFFEGLPAWPRAMRKLRGELEPCVVGLFSWPLASTRAVDRATAASEAGLSSGGGARGVFGAVCSKKAMISSVLRGATPVSAAAGAVDDEGPASKRTIAQTRGSVMLFPFQELGSDRCFSLQNTYALTMTRGCRTKACELVFAR